MIVLIIVSGLLFLSFLVLLKNPSKLQNYHKKQDSFFFSSTDDSEHTPYSCKGPDLDLLTFLDYEDNIVNSGDYDKMVISGKSLGPFNINDGDVIFIRRLTNHEYLTKPIIPKPYVFYREADEENESVFTAGIVISRFNPETVNINDVLEEIINDKRLERIKDDKERYVSDKFILDSLIIPEGVIDVSVMLKIGKKGKYILEALDSKNIFGEIKFSYSVYGFNK